MSTIDLTDKELGAVHAGARSLVVLSNTIDFNENNAAALDVIQALKVGAGDVVLRTVVNVETVEGGTLTFDLGDGDDPNGYMDAVNGNALAITGSALTLTEGTPNTVAAYSGGKLYTAADTIDMVLDNAADAAVIKVSALVARMG